MDISVLQQKMEAGGYDFVPVGLHHDLLPLPNGHLIVLVNFNKSFSNLPGYPGTTEALGDGLIDLDQNWNPVWAWNSFDYLYIDRHLDGLPDWTHSNALLYTADGNLLLSMRHQSWILKIDYNNGTGSGNILWRLGYQGDFALTQNGAVVTDPSVWFSFSIFHQSSIRTGRKPHSRSGTMETFGRTTVAESVSSSRQLAHIRLVIPAPPFFRSTKPAWLPVWCGRIRCNTLDFGAEVSINWATGT